MRNLSSQFLHSVCLLSPVLGSFVCGVHTDYGCEVSVWRFTADLVTVLLFPRSPAPAHYGSFLVTIVSFYTAEPHNYLLPIGTHRDKGWKMSQHPQNYFKRFVVWTRPQHFTILGNKILSALACVDFHIEDLYLTLAWMFVLFSSYWQSPLCKAQKSASGSIFYFTLTFLRFCVWLGGWPAWLRGAE